ncbi:MAG TPA: hypothetical protein VG371_17395 [Solirubrobacteraceae bacterium]|nr:hypothetical protein [Solirubrobacteraceae bacterium]
MRFLNRRPSPAIVISSVALFMSLGGVGYAATQLPQNSVGSFQLRNGAVTFTKIQPGAVGNVRANVRQLQERVWKVCGSNQVMFGANQNGDPKCTNSMPAEVGTTSNTASIPTTGTATSVASATLTSGNNYLGLANPTITVTPSSTATTSQAASVSCTLTVGSNTSTRTLTIMTPDKATPASAALPLQLTGTGGTSAVSCSSKPVGLATGATAPTVSVTSAVNAIQIQ